DLYVLTGVDEIEARDPDRQGEPQHEGRRIECSAHGDPPARRRSAVREAEDPVTRPGETLRVRIADQEERGPGRQLEAERVELPGRESEKRRRQNGGGEHVPGLEETLRQVSARRQRIVRVDQPVGVEGDAYGEGTDA